MAIFTNIFGDAEVAGVSPDIEQDYDFVEDDQIDHHYWHEKFNELIRILNQSDPSPALESNMPMIIHGGAVTDGGSGTINISRGSAIAPFITSVGRSEYRIANIPPLTGLSIPSGWNDGRQLWIVLKYDYAYSGSTRNHYNGPAYHPYLSDTYVGDSNGLNSTDSDDLFVDSSPSSENLCLGSFTMTGTAFVSLDAGERTDTLQPKFYDQIRVQNNWIGFGDDDTNVFISDNDFSSYEHSRCVFIGKDVISNHSYSTDIVDCISIGYKALYSGGGSRNIAIGTEAGYNLGLLGDSYDDNDNTVIGYKALYGTGPSGVSNNDTNKNTVVGAYAMADCSGYAPASNTAIGYYAMYSCSNGVGNVAVGDHALDYCDGTYNTGIGLQSGNTPLTSGADYNTFLGAYSYFTGSNPQYRTSLGASANNTNDNSIRAGRASTDTLYGYNYQADSDIRLKENVKDLELGLDFINSLRPVTYKWKDRKIRNIVKDKDGNDVEKITELTYKRNHAGFIAQEIGQALKGVGIDLGLYNDQGYNKKGKKNIKIDFDNFEMPDDAKSYSIEQLLAITVKAVQELSAKVDALN